MNVDSDLGFLRIAAVAPRVHLADPDANAAEHVAALGMAGDAGIVLFPELSLTGYSCEDLFQLRGLLEGAREALRTVAEATARRPGAVVVGAPCQSHDGRMFNAAFVLAGGRVRGAVPKSYLPNYAEFYEERWFVSGLDADLRIADPRLGEFRLSTRQLFALGEALFAVEICEDLWAPQPPSGAHALAGAAVILNLSASNDWVSKADYRRELVRQQSGRLNAAYAYVSCGPSESTKDLVYGGHAMIVENGTMLAEGRRFELGGTAVSADVDVEKLRHERARNITFGVSPRVDGYSIERLGPMPPPGALKRSFSRTPFVPDDPATVGERAREILALQATGLARRLDASRSETALIGVSGGLDSTLALLVSVEAMKLLGRPAAGVLGVSMPGPGTTAQTRSSAAALMKRLGVTAREIPIHDAVAGHFKDIGHDPEKHDVVFENAQARERTQILFDLANQHRGIVVGTGDLSELALGWCTYNADQASNYNVNVSVPKTLVKHLVRWYAEHVADADTRRVLEGILATVISPELLPPAPDGRIAQSTEDVVGPYELHDFFLWHHLRLGSPPRKVFELAKLAFAGAYDAPTLKKWLRVFVERFYRQQFKRTTLPPGPKVGSLSLSPRGDLRMPDEVDPAALLREVDALPAS
jgi:NAD+ synthase (glutamine-hydrolysing)